MTAESESTGFQAVGRYFDLTEAQVALGALRAEGLQTILRDEHLCGINWMYIVAVGGLRLEAVEAERGLAALRDHGGTDELQPELQEYEAPDLGFERNWKRVVLGVWFAPMPIVIGIAMLLG